jgi:hypothetical protein
LKTGRGWKGSAEIVDGAWDFAQTNRRYARHLGSARPLSGG